MKELGFNVLKLERDNKKGGGLAVLVKRTLCKKVSTVFITEYKGFEGIICIITIANFKINLVNLYRPPINSKTDFLTDFNSFISTLLERDGKTLLFGDFNIDYLEKDRICKELDGILELNGLAQIVKIPTRQTSLLDYIIIQSSDREKSHIIKPDSDFPSDHIPIILSQEYEVFNRKVCTFEKKVRDFRTLNIEALQHELSQSPFATLHQTANLNSEEYVRMYNSTISGIINSLCPVKIRRFKRSESQKWYSSDLRELKQQKRRAERKYRKISTKENLNKYQQLKNSYSSKLKKPGRIIFQTKLKKIRKIAKLCTVL